MLSQRMGLTQKQTSLHKYFPRNMCLKNDLYNNHISGMDLSNNKESLQTINDDDIREKVRIETDDYRRVLPITKAKEWGLHGGPGNGSGNRAKISKLFDHFTIFADNRSCYPVPKNLEPTKEQLEIIEDYKKTLSNQRGTCGFFIVGLKDIRERDSRPIREDISCYYKKRTCVRCGSNKDLIPDHKNDLYNDPRVLNRNTQTLDDFQSFCNGCNLIKRGVSQKRDKEGKRQPPPPDIVAANGGILYTTGDESYDPNDPNALVGTYWYDPIEFGKQCIEIRNIEIRKKLLDAGVPSDIIDSAIDG